MSRDQVEDDIFDWMTLRSFCSSPYLDHPPKAAKVLGTLGSKSPRHDVCQQGPASLMDCTRRSRSWNIESSAGVSSGDLPSPFVSEINSRSSSRRSRVSNEKDTKTSCSLSQSTVILLKTEAASQVATLRQPSQTQGLAEQEKEQEDQQGQEDQQKFPCVADLIQPVGCPSCFSFLQKFKMNFS